MKIVYITGLLLSFSFLQSCEKEIMDFEGQDALFFDVQYGADWGDTTVWAHQFYTLVAFGSVDDTVLDIRIKVAVAGNIKNYDRPFKVDIVSDSTTALCPTEYKLLAEDQVIRAGANCSYVTVQLSKSPRMAKETLKLQLRLIPNEYFSLPFSEVGDIPGRWKDTQTEYSRNADPNVHTIFVNDILARPKGWNDFQLGIFTPTKFALMLELTGWEKSYFDDVNKMQVGRMSLIQRILREYLQQQYGKGREFWVVDEDGSMMWVRGCKWAEGTTPDEMVQN